MLLYLMKFNSDMLLKSIYPLLSLGGHSNEHVLMEVKYGWPRG